MMKQDLSMQSINVVKERYEDWLLSLPGVVGVALSMSRRRTKDGLVDQPVIKVLVSSLKDLKTGSGSSSIPEALESVPVEVEEVGEFNAL
jgi:hypothetical protein